MRGIHPLAFFQFDHHLIWLVEQHLVIPRWRGLRVVAGDGSKVRLTLMKDSVRSIIESMAFDLSPAEIELFLDFVLHEPMFEERQMLFEADDEGVLRLDDLLVLNRGFPSRWLLS